MHHNDAGTRFVTGANLATAASNHIDIRCNFSNNNIAMIWFCNYYFHCFNAKICQSGKVLSRYCPINDINTRNHCYGSTNLAQKLMLGSDCCCHELYANIVVAYICN